MTRSRWMVLWCSVRGIRDSSGRLLVWHAGQAIRASIRSYRHCALYREFFDTDWDAANHRHPSLFRDSNVDTCQERNFFRRRNVPWGK